MSRAWKFLRVTFMSVAKNSCEATLDRSFTENTTDTGCRNVAKRRDDTLWPRRVRGLGGRAPLIATQGERTESEPQGAEGCQTRAKRPRKRRRGHPPPQRRAERPPPEWLQFGNKCSIFKRFCLKNTSFHALSERGCFFAYE